MTDLKVASKSDVEVSFNAIVISRRLAAYFFRAAIVCSGSFVTFDRPAKPTEDTALLNDGSTLSNVHGGEPRAKSTSPLRGLEPDVT